MASFAFNSNSQNLDLINAFYLSNISNLAYQTPDQITAQLESSYGLTQCKIFENKNTDTQAFLAANDLVVLLAFRGTVESSIQDWFTDAKIALVPSKVGRVHCGFNETLNSIWNDIYDTICTWKVESQNVWVTGHSLGGALATLAVNQLRGQDMDVQGLYTYGQPRVGDENFVAAFKYNMPYSTFRFVNNADVVTQIPFPPAYKHIDAECFFDNKGTLYTKNIFWNWFRSVSEDVAQRTQVDDVSTYVSKRPGGVADHSLDFYIKYLTPK